MPSLIWLLEVGARTGLIELLGDKARLQQFLSETVYKSNSSYIVLIDNNGGVLAQGNPEKAKPTEQDYVFVPEHAPSDEPQWRMIETQDTPP